MVDRTGTGGAGDARPLGADHPAPAREGAVAGISERMYFSVLGAFLHGPVRVRIVTRVTQRIIRAEAKSELDVAMHYVWAYGTFVSTNDDSIELFIDL